MKFEYVPSAFGISPDLLIAGAEFKKAWENREDYNNLHYAVDAFTCAHGFNNNLYDRDYRLANRWLRKNSSILFVVKEDKFIRSQVKRWCEIYVVTEGKIQNIVTSEDGENFEIRQPDK